MITVSVTRADIDGALPGSSCDCAVAWALTRATGVPWWVELERCRPRIGDREDWYELPAAVADWIEGYDRGEPCPPLEFSFDYPA